VEAFCLTPVIACLFFVASVLSMLEMQDYTIMPNHAALSTSGFCLLFCLHAASLVVNSSSVYFKRIHYVLRPN
jgi:Tfp pilus assembly protein PilV